MIWLSVIGIGQNGLESLTAAALGALNAAEVVIGAKRHHAMVPDLQAKRLIWPSPFSALQKDIAALRGQRVAILVTGDPLWYSAGEHFAQKFSGEVQFFPQISAFQWAAARMGWRFNDCDMLSLHGRPNEEILPFLAENAQLLVLTQNEKTPSEIGTILKHAGFGESTVSVLADLGGATEKIETAPARDWVGRISPAFHTLAISCRANEKARALPRIGLDDAFFEHDGKMTKSEIRALTLLALAPRRNQLLWDIGAGCGSVGIEWMRAAQGAGAIGIEPNAARRTLAATNAARLGTPRLNLIDATAPEGLTDLPAPDAIFIGGGLSCDTITKAQSALSPGGRLVVNAVTLGSESLLTKFFDKTGGELKRLAVSRAEPIGKFTAWRPLMPVTQWVWVK